MTSFANLFAAVTPDALQRLPGLGGVPPVTLLRQVANLIASEGYGAAVPVLDERLSRWPREVDTLLMRANCMAHLGRFDIARQDLATALQAAPARADVIALKTLLATDDLDPPALREAFAEALAQAPADVQAQPQFRAALAKDAFLRGDRTGAFNGINDAALSAPNDPWVRMVQCDITTALLGPTPAAPIAEHLARIAPTSPAALWQGIHTTRVELLGPEQMAAQKAMAAKLALLGPGGAWGALAAAHLGLQQQFNLDDAEGHPQWQGPGPMLALQLAQAHLASLRGDAAQAEEALTHAAKIYRHAPTVLQARADLASRNGASPEDLVAALTACRDAAAGQQFVLYSFKLALAHLRGNNHAEAQACLRGLLKADPDHGESLVALAKSLLVTLGPPPHDADANSCYNEAEALARRAWNQGGAVAAEGRYILGLVVANTVEALEHLKAALEAFAGDPERTTEMKMALLARLVQAGQYADAQEVLDTVPESLWTPLLGNSTEGLEALAQFRATRLADDTIDAARRAYDAHNYRAAITAIEAVENNPYVQEDIRRLTELKGIKALAYKEIKLRPEALQAAHESMALARAYAQTTPVTEANMVVRGIEERVKEERRGFWLDTLSKIAWTFIFTGAGLTSIYSLGLNAFAALRSRVGMGQAHANAAAAASGHAPVHGV